MNSGYVRRQPPKVPKDGFGPRGVPDCYYTSRVLNSTFLYVQFVKKLRQQEEDDRIKDIREKIESKENCQQEFFIRCDRRRLINRTSIRVDCCMQAYQDYLKERKQKLFEVLSAEEERNIRLLVESVQAGYELAWNAKIDRLNYLIAKRKKEHEEKYQDTPLSKSAHVLPCIYKIRSKEAEEIQLYQMREKQMRKLAQKEMDKMWYEVVMKESEALAARAEYETVERYRRDQEAKQLSLDIIEQRRLKRAKEQEMLKQETLRLKAKFEDDNRKAEEEERQRQEYKREVVREINNVMEDRKKVLAQRKEDARVISSTWDSLAGQGLADENAKEQRRRRKLRELGECNRQMIELKNNLEEFKNSSDPLIFEEGQRRQDEVDLKRCRYRVYTRKLSKDIGAHIQNQIKEKEEALKNRCDETEDIYNKQVSEQLEKLVKHKELTDSQARKLNQKDIQRQIEYNRVLQERARQDAILEQKKCQIARDQYQEEIKKMLSRPFFSDHVHPFMKQMASGLKMCRCGACPNYCLYPSNN